LNDKDLWNAFLNSGKVEDYLRYKGNISPEKEAKQFESYHNEWFDNQGTKGWRS